MKPVVFTHYEGCDRPYYTMGMSRFHQQSGARPRLLVGRGRNLGTPPSPRQRLRPCTPLAGEEGQNWTTPPSPRQGPPCTPLVMGWMWESIWGHPQTPAG